MQKEVKVMCEHCSKEFTVILEDEDENLSGQTIERFCPHCEMKNRFSSSDIMFYTLLELT